MGLLKWFRSLLGKKQTPIDRLNVAADEAVVLGEQLRHAIAADRPDLAYRYQINPLPSGHFFVDVWLGEGSDQRFLVIEKNLSEKTKGQNYGCSDCTTEDCAFSGPQEVFVTYLGVIIWARRIAFKMPRNDAQK